MNYEDFLTSSNESEGDYYGKGTEWKIEYITIKDLFDIVGKICS